MASTTKMKTCVVEGRREAMSAAANMMALKLNAPLTLQPAHETRGKTHTGRDGCPGQPAGREPATGTILAGRPHSRRSRAGDVVVVEANVHCREQDGLRPDGVVGVALRKRLQDGREREKHRQEDSRVLEHGGDGGYQRGRVELGAGESKPKQQRDDHHRVHCGDG